jgi:hypothetical protein
MTSTLVHRIYIIPLVAALYATFMGVALLGQDDKVTVVGNGG